MVMTHKNTLLFWQMLRAYLMLLNQILAENWSPQKVRLKFLYFIFITRHNLSDIYTDNKVRLTVECEYS